MTQDDCDHLPRGRPPRSRTADVAGYLAVGGLSVVLDVGLLLLLVEVVGVRVPVATTVAFLVCVAVNFGLNRLLAGGTGTTLLGRQVLRYLLLLGANLVVTVLVVSSSQALGLPYLAGKLAVVAASTAWNYVLYRRWVFTPERRPAPQS